MQRVQLALPPIVQGILIAFAVWLVLRFIDQTLWVWILVLLALILAAAMAPMVRLLEQPGIPPRGWHIPRGLAVHRDPAGRCTVRRNRGTHRHPGVGGDPDRLRPGRSAVDPAP